MNDRILIIGSGLAGITLVREIRKLDKTREILVLSADDGSFYSKPNLSNAFAAGKAPADLVLTPAARLEKDLSIRIRGHTQVVGIDADAREVLAPDARFTYGQLVLAVGASQIALPFAGDGARDVVSVNSLDDYSRLRSRMAGRRRVAIVGAGLIGCEFANDMCLGGFEVEVFDVAEQPLARLLPPLAAHHLRNKLEAAGVVFRMGVRLEAVHRQEDGYLLADAHGAAGKYDLVLSAVGLRPNLELARSAGLTVRTGIVADAYLRTSDPHIYALGDCVEMGGMFLPYVAPIMQGARKLAATLTGTPQSVEYPAMPIVVKTPACPTVVSPPPTGTGRWEEALSEEGLRALFIDGETESASGFVLQGGPTRERTALAATMPKLYPG